MYENEMFAGWQIVGEPIGKGGFSKVYKIRKDDGVGGEYYSAMKVITIPSSEDEYNHYVEDGYDAQSISTIFKNQVATLANELKILSQFRGNTNIVSYEDHKIVPQPDGYSWRIFIRMELLDTLPAINNQSPLTVKETVKLGIDICKALLVCEKKNVIHRDIKPQNIFVNRDGDYKLGDFGIARTMDHNTRATKIGTPAYMAPEVFNGNAYGSAVDIYSLGMVLYWLLNERRLPFLPLPPAIPTNTDNIEAQNKRLNGMPLPPPKNGTPALKDAVLKACAFDPNQRFRSASALKNALEWILTTLDDGGHRVAPPYVQRPAPQPRPNPQGIPRPIPQQPAPPVQPVAPKKSKALPIILICLLVAIVGGVVAYFTVFKDKEGGNGGDNVIHQSTAPDASSKPDVPESEAPDHSHTDSTISNVIDDDSRPHSEVPDSSVNDSDVKSEENSDAESNVDSVVESEVPDESYEIDFSQNPDYEIIGSVKHSGTLGSLKWEVYTDGTLLISGNGKMEDLSWYEELEWAVYRNEIYKVVVEEGVTSIGAYAFSQHEKVTSIILPQSVKTLGLNSFRSCISIKELYIPSDVNFIAEDAFAFCTSLESINIPRGVKSIEKWLFGYCTSLKNIYYDGTTEQWKALPKGLNWFKDTVGFEVICKDGVVSHTINANYTLAYSTYTVTLTDNGNGTATITAAVPAGVYSGKIVIDVSSNLSLISGSLRGNGVCNENYDEGGVSGACVSYASGTALANGEIVFSADYRINSGASLDFSDFGAPFWQLTKDGSSAGSQNGGNDVLKKLVK